MQIHKLLSWAVKNHSWYHFRLRFDIVVRLMHSYTNAHIHYSNSNATSFDSVVFSFLIDVIFVWVQLFQKCTNITSKLPVARYYYCFFFSLLFLLLPHSLCYSFIHIATWWIVSINFQLFLGAAVIIRCCFSLCLSLSFAHDGYTTKQVLVQKNSTNLTLSLE